MENRSSKNLKTKDVFISSGCKGVITSSCLGFKVKENTVVSRTEYTTFNIPVNSTFKVVRFNIATRRAVVFLQTPDESVPFIELDYDTILNNSTLEEINVFKPVDHMLLVYKENPVITSETLYKILYFVLTCSVFFILGKVC